MTDVDPPPADTGRVVVGVDGSAESIDALRWAARHAAATAARVEVVTAWDPRVGTAGPFIVAADGTYTTAQEVARESLARVVRVVYGNDRPPDVELRARRGHAADVLINESANAALLVIGSRGLGEVAGLLLGSVSARCAEKARCPVLIMHGHS